MNIPQTSRRLYPVGIRSFPDIRRNGYVYVDKTALVHRLANESDGTFFLNRPPRFGKTLLASTVQAYFEGRRELFAGLAIEGLETAWESFPVIRLDFGTAGRTAGCSAGARDPKPFEGLFDAVLASNEAIWGRNEAMKTPGSRLMGLIRSAYNKTGKPVVVLVDDYDAPLLDALGEPGASPEALPALLNTMAEFFAPLKACDAYLRFAFVTGVSKYLRLDTSGCFNNLVDISMWPDYATICGVTERELESQLGCDVAELGRSLGLGDAAALDAIERHYSGYRFAFPSPCVCNPYSLLAALRDGRVGPYSLDAGVPSFLAELFEELPEGREWDVLALEGRKAREGEFDVPSRWQKAPLPMLYQGGYLTIKSYDSASHAFTLGIPNEEARAAMTQTRRRLSSTATPPGENGPSMGR